MDTRLFFLLPTEGLVRGYTQYLYGALPLCIPSIQIELLSWVKSYELRFLELGCIDRWVIYMHKWWTLISVLSHVWLELSDYYIYTTNNWMFEHGEVSHAGVQLYHETKMDFTTLTTKRWSLGVKSCWCIKVAFLNIWKLAKCHVFLDTIFCSFSEATLNQYFVLLGSYKTLLLHAWCCHIECWGMLLKYWVGCSLNDWTVNYLSFSQWISTASHQVIGMYRSLPMQWWKSCFVSWDIFTAYMQA